MQDKRREELQNVIKTRNDVQREITDKYNDKDKRIDFIQKLIDQSHKQSMVLAQVENEIQYPELNNLGKTPGDLHIR